VWTSFAYHQIVTQNVVSNSWWPVVVQGGWLNTVQNNNISDALYDGILDYSSFGGNNITRNTVNEAQFGIFADTSTSGDILVPNTFDGTVTTIDPGPPQTPADPVQP